MKFTDLLDKYLDVKNLYDTEKAKGINSNHYDDTYGFGKLAEKLSSAKNDLDWYMEDTKGLPERAEFVFEGKSGHWKPKGDCKPLPKKVETKFKSGGRTPPPKR